MNDDSGEERMPRHRLLLTVAYLAIGGINARNAADVVRAGASGV